MRVRTPTILQMEAVECGAVALGIVLGHYGRFVPLEQLRTACGVSRDGSKASNMVKAAATYGLKARGFKREPEELRAMPLPLVVFWNFNHFLVVEGFSKDRVFLNDPATGPRTVTHEEFDLSFTGVVITFEKTETFAPGGKPPRVVDALLRRLPGNRGALVYALLATLALLLPTLALPALSRVFVDRVVSAGIHTWLYPVLAAMAATAGLSAMLTWLQQSALLRLEMNLALDGSARFFHHVLRLPMTFFSQRGSGDIAQRVAINDSVASLLSGELATNFVGLLLIGFYSALMFRYSVPLTLLSLGFAALNMLALQYVSRTRADLNRRLQQDKGKLMGMSMSGLATIETLKATGASSDFFARWSGLHTNVFNVEQELGASSAMLSTLPPFLAAVNAALVLVIGGRSIMDGALTAGMLLAFQGMMMSLSEPVDQLLGLGQRMQELHADMARLDDVLDHPEDALLSASGDPAAQPDGCLEIRDITFGYSRLESPLLKNFSLTLAPGERVALAGGSGSGKSTVARLVSGLYTPWSGEIRYGAAGQPHRPRHELSRDALAQAVAMVDQDIFLFEGTVRDNLTLWDNTIADAALHAALRDACLADEIAARPGGLDEPVEEGGRNFSGGQRQRLELARALVRNPKLLILDEATSALDAATEKRVMDNLLSRGCACLIVAHRLSTIRDCEEIIVLSRGLAVERGNHTQLMENEGEYARLIRAA